MKEGILFEKSIVFIPVLIVAAVVAACNRDDAKVPANAPKEKPAVTAPANPVVVPNTK